MDDWYTWNMWNRREWWERRHSWRGRALGHLTRPMTIIHWLETYLFATAVLCSPFQIIQLFYYWCYLKCVEYERMRVVRETSVWWCAWHDTQKHTSHCSDLLSFDQVIQFYHFCIDHLIGKETELLVGGDREQTSQCTATRGATRHLKSISLWNGKKKACQKGKNDTIYYRTNIPITSDHWLVFRIITCAATVPFLPLSWCNERDLWCEWKGKRPLTAKQIWTVEMYEHLSVLWFKSYFILSTWLDILIQPTFILVVYSQRSLQGQTNRRCFLHQGSAMMRNVI
jgi:hypothetical protein